MIEYILFILGLILLVKGADWLVEGAARIARKYGISNMVIGLTIVAFGTSLPELIVNVASAINGVTNIALGNIIGSNIANILLVLGLAGIITDIFVKKTTVKREIPFSLYASFLLLVMASDYYLNHKYFNLISRIDGIILIGFFVIFLYYLFTQNYEEKLDIDYKNHEHSLKLIIYIILGTIGLFIGGELVVKYAVIIAKNIGISEFLISSTIIALGTSLPELVTSLVAIKKKHIDLSVGNIVGSNIFNILLILGLTSIIKPINVPNYITLDLIFLFAISILLLVFMYTGTKEKHKLDKKEAIIFLLLYVVYVLFLIYRG